MAQGRRTSLLGDRGALLALGGGLALTFLVAWLLAATTLERDRQDFDAAARQARAAVVSKVETSVALLRGTAGLFAGGEAITLQRFRAYVDRLALRERYPGLLGIGFSLRLRPGESSWIAEEMGRQGHGGFRVWPPREGERHSIVFLEPLDERNRAALGYDMSSDPVRREAMERARDSGLATASAVVELVQEIHAAKQPGFLIYLPVYQGGTLPASTEQRRERLVGFVYAPIRALDFLSSAFAHEEFPTVGLAIHHGTGTGDGALLYQRGMNGTRARFTDRQTVYVGGQPWTFAFSSRNTIAQSLAMPVAVVLVGVALSFLLAVLMGRERRARGAAQHALEAERAARSEAERANRMKDEFLATLSHELRTPLHAIIGWASLLRHPGLAEEQRRMGVEVVERNARAQARLIEDLLDMNRIATGKITLELQTLDPSAVLLDAVKSLAPTAQAKNVELRCETTPGTMTVRADPARLLQIFWNILSNAVKFTPAGGRVVARLGASDGRARLAVVDTGEGIDPESVERIFDRFAQADGSIARRHGGLGLGLAIVRQLVELHRGSVRAHSAGVGQGATFIVELPLVQGPAEAVPRAAAANEPRRGYGTLAGVRVLVVEDDADARELIRSVLAERGADVRATASAGEALEAMRAEPPDVLLSDVGMAGVDGYALLRQVRSLPPDKGGRVPAAAITAYARDADREAALRAGFDLHLVKPLRGEALVEAVLALLERGARARAA